MWHQCHLLRMITPERMQSPAHARPGTQTQVVPRKWCAQVKSAAQLAFRSENGLCTWCLLGVDTCQVKNGGCDGNAVCSHDGTSNAVVCTCKIGYTNAGSATNVTCTGERTLSIAGFYHTTVLFSPLLIDTCLVNNGACDANAVCSHDGTSNAVVCSCKTGYTNTGNSSNVTCTGKRNFALRWV